MEHSKTIRAVLSVILLAGSTTAGLAPRAEAAAAPSGPSPAASGSPSLAGLPTGFANWDEVFAVQNPLNEAGFRIQDAASAQPDSGYTSFSVELTTRSIKVYWRGQPSKVEQAVIDEVRRVRGVGVNLFPAKYSRIELEAKAELVKRDATGTGDERILSIAHQPDGSGIQVGISSPSGDAPGTNAAPANRAGSLGKALPHLQTAIRAGGVTVVAEKPSRTFTREADGYPFSGGGVVFNPAVWSACSSGFSTYSPLGSEWMLTAAHCGPMGSDWVNGNGYLIGRATGRSVLHDALFIHTTPRGGSGPYVYDGPGIFRSGQVRKPVRGAAHVGIGSYICISGALTGIVCSTEVKHQAYDHCPVTPGCIRALDALSTIGQNVAGQADSGGPIFVLTGDGSGVLAVGLVHGAYGTLDPNCANPLFGHYNGFAATRLCSTGLRFTDVLDAMAVYPGMYIKTG